MFSARNSGDHAPVMLEHIGLSSMVDISRMPDSAMFSVRGMGVDDEQSSEVFLVRHAEALLLVDD